MEHITRPGVTVAEVLKALSDPIRWDIVHQVAEVDEFPCARLVDTLPISKPTISYHTKILAHAGVIVVRKKGRSLFYELNRDVLRSIVDELWSLAPAPRPVTDGYIDHEIGASRRRKARPVTESAHSGEVAILTW